MDDLLSFYKCFLMNYFRKVLEIMGMFIKIEFREGNNLFEGKKVNLILV